VARRRGSRIASLLAFLFSLGLGGMLLFAALQKSADPRLFVEQIQGYKIFPALAVPAAYAFLWAEFILGFSLVLYLWPRPALAGFIALMLLFIGVTGWTWAHGNTAGCGCFGRLASRPPKEVMLEDGLYVLAAAVAFWLSSSGAAAKGRWMAYGIVLPILLALPWALPRLPVDSLVTPVRAGADLEDLAAEDLKFPLTEGRVFVAFLGDDCPRCVEALPAMEALGQAEGAPAVTAIFAGDRKAKRSWALEHVPSFPLAYAPVKTLRQYYRKLPVFLLLDQGRVRKVWWDRTPRPEEVLRAL
jgi:hypothetical protein